MWKGKRREERKGGNGIEDRFGSKRSYEKEGIIEGEGKGKKNKGE